jgi:hypothetical protein
MPVALELATLGPVLDERMGNLISALAAAGVGQRVDLLGKIGATKGLHAGRFNEALEGPEVTGGRHYSHDNGPFPCWIMFEEFAAASRRMGPGAHKLSGSLI